MIRKHFFLIFAAILIVGLLVFGGFKLMAGGGASPQGGGQAAAGGGSGGGAGGRGGPGGGPGGRGGGGRGAIQVTAVSAVPHTFADTINVLGVAKARQSVTITSSASELVTNVLFHDGQEVKAGQTLLELKAQAEDANIATASANLALAKANAQRYATLAQQGIIAQATADQYQTAAQTAQAALDTANAGKLDRVIRAPFSGRLGLSDIAPGALISPGSPIASLDDLSVVKVDFPVPDRYLSLLKIGQPIIATANSLPGKTFNGRIAQVDTRVDEKTRTVNTRAEFPNPGETIRPGMLMSVAIPSGAHQGLALPQSAIQIQNDQSSVYLLTDNSGRTVAQSTQITTGDMDGELVDVTSGLQVGARVIGDGLDKVTPGATVTVAGSGPGGRGGGRRGGDQGRGGGPGAGGPNASGTGPGSNGGGPGGRRGGPGAQGDAGTPGGPGGDRRGGGRRGGGGGQ